MSKKSRSGRVRDKWREKSWLVVEAPQTFNRMPVAYIPIRAGVRDGKSNIKLAKDGMRFFIIILNHILPQTSPFFSMYMSLFSLKIKKTDILAGYATGSTLLSVHICKKFNNLI